MIHKRETYTMAAKRKKTADHPGNTVEYYVQYLGKDVAVQDVETEIHRLWKDELGHRPEELKDLKIYFKTEENRAYYVINGNVFGSLDI